MTTPGRLELVVDTRLQSWIRLAQCDALKPRMLHALLSELRSPEVILDASASTLSRIVPAEVAQAIRSSRSATGEQGIDATIEWASTAGNLLLTWDDERYPKALLELTDPPPMLFCRGEPARLNEPALAMVGSRNASPGGLQTAEEFAEAFASSGVNVVSGLALGIDGAAHRGALKAAGPASTIAVIGTGIDRVYPARNRDLAHQIAGRGIIVSEFALGTPPLAYNFPRRNRLISGLARGVLVVEAALNSGSLITARFAAEQGKDVFAIPGSIHSPFSKGCHRLIKDGAKLVETAADVLEELGLAAAVSARSRGKTRSDAVGGRLAPLGEPGEDDRQLLDALGYDPVSADEAVSRTGWSIERVLSTLLHLELGGSVARLPGDRVQRVS